jgi:hypothetical protein
MSCAGEAMVRKYYHFKEQANSETRILLQQAIDEQKTRIKAADDAAKAVQRAIIRIEEPA